jgi:predicted RNase H-like HicB family nuclease
MSQRGGGLPAQARESSPTPLPAGFLWSHNCGQPFKNHQYEQRRRYLPKGVHMNFSIECEREEDGRWIAEIPELPGALAYGKTPAEAMVRALRAIAEQLEHGEIGPKAISISIPA